MTGAIDAGAGTGVLLADIGIEELLVLAFLLLPLLGRVVEGLVRLFTRAREVADGERRSRRPWGEPRESGDADEAVAGSEPPSGRAAEEEELDAGELFRRLLRGEVTSTTRAPVAPPPLATGPPGPPLRSGPPSSSPRRHPTLVPERVQPAPERAADAPALVDLEAELATPPQAIPTAAVQPGAGPAALPGATVPGPDASTGEAAAAAPAAEATPAPRVRLPGRGEDWARALLLAEVLAPPLALRTDVTRLASLPGVPEA